MKWIGFILVTVGFVLAALAAVVDRSAIESAEQEPSVLADTDREARIPAMETLVRSLMFSGSARELFKFAWMYSIALTANRCTWL